MRGNLRAASAAVAAVVFAVGLAGCSPSVRSQAEDNLFNDIAEAVASAGYATSRASTVADLEGHLTFIDQRAAVANGSLDEVATGWYQMDDLPDHHVSIDIIAVGTAYGSEGLTYSDALVFRCVRITAKLGTGKPDAHGDRIDCPAAVRKAAHIIPDTPEV